MKTRLLAVGSGMIVLAAALLVGCSSGQQQAGQQQVGQQQVEPADAISRVLSGDRSSAACDAAIEQVGIDGADLIDSDLGLIRMDSVSLRDVSRAQRDAGRFITRAGQVRTYCWSSSGIFQNTITRQAIEGVRSAISYVDAKYR